MDTHNFHFQNMQDEVLALGSQLDYIKDTTESLLMDAPEGTDTDHVIAARDDLTRRYENLVRDIEDILGHLEQGSEAVHGIQVIFSSVNPVLNLYKFENDPS